MSKLFFALWPDDETRAQIHKVSQLFAGRNCRLTRSCNLHITLVFLGAIPSLEHGRLIADADNIQSNSFSLRLEKIGVWKRTEVLWLSPGKIPAALEHLVRAIQKCAQRQGLPVDSRPYKPHVTLAKKVKENIKTLSLSGIDWRVDNFILVESRQTKSGSEYHTLHEWPLKK